MARNWAICIGINKYENLTPLRFAVRDADCMRDWFEKEAGFEKVYLFTDNSPQITDTDASKPYQTKPTYGRLMRFLENRFAKPFLSVGNNLWFFFSGHGLRQRDRDYLMLSDSSASAGSLIEKTAISLIYVTERLRRSGADNVILIYDACRNEGSSKGLGVGEERYKGVITIASCRPDERSFEIEDLYNGSFTYALLESLRIQGTGNCATVERLDQRLCRRVPELNRKYQKASQNPYVIAEPLSKSQLILLPSQATLQDVSALKGEAYRAKDNNELELAKTFMTQVLIASPADPDALAWFKNIWLEELKWQHKELKWQHKFEILGLEKSHETKIRELEQSYQNKRQELEQSLQAQIKQLEQQLEQERAQASKQQSNLEANIKAAQVKLAEKESIIAQLQSSPQVAVTGEVELKTEKGINYTKLRDLLAAGKWKEADRETTLTMLQAAGRESERWLRVEDIDNFPCEDLRTINQIWLHYSKGKFGFSIQKEIYESLGGTREYNEKVWKDFCSRVGWRKGGNWVYYDDLTFNVEDAPRAHLPVTVTVTGGSFGVGVSTREMWLRGVGFSSLAQRLGCQAYF